MMYLTPIQVAKRLKVSLVTVQRYCRRGLFAGAIQIGRSWGIPPAALVGFRKPEMGNPLHRLRRETTKTT